MRIIERKGKMSNIKLWTRNFITLLGANGLLFAGFHFLLPTLPNASVKPLNLFMGI